MFVFDGDDAHSMLLLLEMMLCTFVISKDVVDPASFDNFFVFSVFLLQSICAVRCVSCSTWYCKIDNKIEVFTPTWTAVQLALRM